MQKGLTRNMVAQIVAADLPAGACVNLGIGFPTLIADHLSPSKGILLQSEQGLLGLGPKARPGHEDPDVVNAGKEYVTLVKGAAVFSHSDSFLMIRGGHIDVACLGAFQVSEQGDLANWSTGDSSQIPGVGGAMDLAAGARNVWVLMNHVTRRGDPKIMDVCNYPLTGVGCVSRIYTDLAMMEVTPQGLKVRRLAPGVSFEYVQSRTTAQLIQSDSLTEYH